LRRKVATVPLTCQSYEMPQYSSCTKPYKPYQFSSQSEVDNDNDDVEHYRGCNNNFVREQREAIGEHERAIQQAIDDWNRFVREMFDVSSAARLVAAIPRNSANAAGELVWG
jgi:hypothetical protein